MFVVVFTARSSPFMVGFNGNALEAQSADGNDDGTQSVPAGKHQCSAIIADRKARDLLNIPRTGGHCRILRGQMQKNLLHNN